MTIAIILNTKKGNHFLIALLLVARTGEKSNLFDSYLAEIQQYYKSDICNHV